MLISTLTLVNEIFSKYTGFLWRRKLDRSMKRLIFATTEAYGKSVNNIINKYLMNSIINTLLRYS